MKNLLLLLSIFSISFTINAKNVDYNEMTLADIYSSPFTKILELEVKKLPEQAANNLNTYTYKIEGYDNLFMSIEMSSHQVKPLPGAKVKMDFLQVSCDVGVTHKDYPFSNSQGHECLMSDHNRNIRALHVYVLMNNRGSPLVHKKLKDLKQVLGKYFKFTVIER